VNRVIAAQIQFIVVEMLLINDQNELFDAVGLLLNGLTQLFDEPMQMFDNP